MSAELYVDDRIARPVRALEATGELDASSSQRLR